MSDRGMKKWAAYRALIEQMPQVNETVKTRVKPQRPAISSDIAEEINYILTQYQGELLEIRIWKRDHEEIFKAQIRKIDPVNKKLILSNNLYINLKDIIGLKII